MEDPDIVSRIGRRLWRDQIHPNSYADIETVADFAVDSTHEGRAKELCEDLADDPESPIVWGVAGEAVAIERDKVAVAHFIAEHGGEEALPWDLRDALDDTEGD